MSIEPPRSCENRQFTFSVDGRPVATFTSGKTTANREWSVGVSGADYGVSIATLDAPLVEPGAMTDERRGDRSTRTWRDRTAQGTTLYACLLNNDWHANYKADQPGPLSFRFAIRPHVRRLADAEEVQKIVRRRLDTYDRMWDGCGCKVELPGLTYRHIGDMVYHMKTTLNIDDTVMAQLKREAARQGRTMSELVETALRLLFQSRRRASELPALPTMKSGGAMVDVADREALYQAMEGR